MAFLINNQFPGPMIKANWGDTVVVKLTNLLPNSIDNGTSLHFHGVRQNGTNEYDGVSSITQCPLAPGDTMTYTWRATSYGSSWWHSHFSLQTYEGMFGPLVIEGPSTLSYDEEQFVILQDWNHATADSLFDDSQVVVPGVRGGGLTLDTGLINGKNVWGNGGEYWSMTVTPGKSYRLRVLNAAIQSTFKFHIDGHSFQVIAMDFVPIHPYTTDIVSVNIGQRYDLILTANQAPANYWIRSDNQQPCGQLEQPNVQAILNYEGVKFATPTTTGLNYQPDCLDEPSASLVPYLAQNAGAQSAGEFVETSIIAANGAVPNLYKWTLSGSTFQANWNDPTLFSIWYDGDVPQYGGDLTVELPNAGEWVYFVIDSPMPLPHPIHLHGHDFFLLASGVGTYSADVPLQLTNPPRRDVAVMPADPLTGSGGYLVVAYQVSNPGVWLMHCHIGWHNTMGFALQIVEMIDSIKIENTCQLQETCVNWLNYANANSIFDAPFDDGV
ncbi:laccase II [Neohortaea acidophila]|uniref:Laccase II n=1 Tax=Neohortaea acidophila TaxID=245834 RepID=A0A6A6PRW5_9PEZI|nr:laccase II [Neohortaea acidophila]KAF2482404.1 laccase II [Neohortaea acidophila]